MDLLGLSATNKPSCRRCAFERDHAGKRRVRELIHVAGYNHAEQSFETEEIYRAPADAA